MALNINPKLLAEAQKLSGLKTKHQTVNEALAEYVQRRKQKKILRLFGKLELDPAYDHKALRRTR
jgi:Arc/MetJ family transcription regulator